jgi:hypothetical protein
MLVRRNCHKTDQPLKYATGTICNYISCRFYKNDMTGVVVTSSIPLPRKTPQKEINYTALRQSVCKQLINGSRISSAAAGSVSCWVRPN